MAYNNKIECRRDVITKSKHRWTKVSRLDKSNEG